MNQYSPLPAMRFQVAGSAVAAAARVLNRPLDRSPMLRSQPVNDAERTVREAHLVGQDGRISNEIEVLVDTLVSPGRTLVLTANQSGSPVLVNSWIGYAPGGEVLMVSRDGTELDVAVLSNIDQALVAIAGALSLTPGSPEADAAEVTLSRRGLVSLLAVADAVQLARLHARLDRLGIVTPVLTLTQIESQIRAGLTNHDSRWSVTAGRLSAPLGLELDDGDLERGLAEVVAKGLAQRDESGRFRVADAGQCLVDCLGQIVAAGSLSIVSTRNAGDVIEASVGFIRCISGTIALLWNGTGPEASVLVTSVGTAGALTLINSLLRGETPTADTGQATAGASEPASGPSSEPTWFWVDESVVARDRGGVPMATLQPGVWYQAIGEEPGLVELDIDGRRAWVAKADVRSDG